MRFSAVVALLAAGVASAALLPRQDALPACAATCVGGAETECSLTDNACLCQDTAFVAAVTQCITTTCQGDDLTTAIAGAQAMCADSGVTLTDSAAPSTTGTATGTGTGTSTGTGTRTTATSSGTSTTGTSATQTSPAATNTAAGGNGALTNGVSAAAGIAAVVLGAVML